MFQLNEGDQQLLLRISRNAVLTHLTDTTPIASDIPPGFLTEPHAVFVSIHKGQKLRGCIGNIYPTRPLYQSARECAISAAVGDPRFMPLRKTELPEVTFEISVLSRLERVENIDEIVVGAHGLHISRGKACGLLLPQVASSNGWDRYRFLSEICHKAGLRHDDWKEGSTIHRFSALVFGEHNIQLSSTS